MAVDTRGAVYAADTHGQRVGDGYRDTVFLCAGETIAPLAAPTEAIPVADLFP